MSINQFIGGVSYQFSHGKHRFKVSNEPDLENRLFFGKDFLEPFENATKHLNFYKIECGLWTVNFDYKKTKPLGKPTNVFYASNEPAKVQEYAESVHNNFTIEKIGEQLMLGKKAYESTLEILANQQ